MSPLQLYSSKNLDIFSTQTETELSLPVLGEIKVGFSSPANDFVDLSIDLNRYLIKHPSATYIAKVKGHSMRDFGINEGDLLIVDKSVEPTDGKIAVCFLDGEYTLKRIKKDMIGLWLMSANDELNSIQIIEENDLRIWGILAHAIKSV